MRSEFLRHSTNRKRSVDTQHVVERSCAVVVDHGEDYGHVLSEEARRNFDVIRSIVADCNESDASHLDALVSPPPAIRLKRKKLDEVASTTVKMIQDEISQWQRSIAELEGMLAAASDGMVAAVNSVEEETDSNEILEDLVLRTEGQGLSLLKDSSSREQARSVLGTYPEQHTWVEDRFYSWSVAHASEDEEETGPDTSEDQED